MNTSYVPLEHPYQIIEYQGVLGIQIGTLIVTVDKSDDSEMGYAIETHSHPVVSYVNNKIHTDMKIHRSLSLPRPYEGVVWDKVELHDLRTLVRECEMLRWNDFMDYCRRLRIGELEGTHKNVDAAIIDNYGLLLDWGIDIEEPKMSKYGQRLLKVELAGFVKYGDTEYLTTEGDLGIVVKKEDSILMVSQMFKQVEFYLSMMNLFQIDSCKVKFWTQDLFLQDLVDEIKWAWNNYQENKLSYPQDDEEDMGMWMAAEDLSDPEPDD